MISHPEVTGHSTTFELTVDMNNVSKEYTTSQMCSVNPSWQLANHRPYNLKITLDKGTSPPFSPIYSLSQEELAALHKFIGENLLQVHSSLSLPHELRPLFIQEERRLLFDFASISRPQPNLQERLISTSAHSDLLDAPQKA